MEGQVLLQELRALSFHFKSSPILDKRIDLKSHSIQIHTHDFDAPLIFTFDFMDVSEKKKLIEKEGWGFKFLKNNGFNVCSFILEDVYSWYRSQEFMEIMSIIKQTNPFLNFQNKISYGSSMGGYAASAFADALQVNKAILMNPISTLNKKLAPFEKRFSEVRNKNNWHENYHDGAFEARNVPLFIIYDSLFKLDHRHVLRYKFQNNKSVEEIRIPGVGHGIPWHLLALKVQKPLVLSLINDEFSDYKSTFYKKIRSRKNYKGYYSFLLSNQNSHLTPKREQTILSNYISFLFENQANIGKVIEEISKVNLRFHSETSKLFLNQVNKKN